MALFKKLGLFKAPAGETAWQPPSTLDHGAVGRVCCIMDRDGRSQVIWENHGSIWLQTLGLEGESTFARMSLGPGEAPQVAANPDGAGVITWIGRAAGGCSLLSLPISAWKTPGASRILFTTPGQVRFLQIAADRRGSAMVVWAHEHGGSFEVLASRFDSRARTWDQVPVRLGPAAPHALEPRLALNRRGQAVVVWNEHSRETDALVGCFFEPAGAAWSEPVPLATGRVSEYQIGLDHAASLMLLTVRQDFGQRPRLEARVGSAGGAAWHAPQVLASAQSFRQVRLAMTGTGEGLAVWQQSEGTTLSFLYGKAYRDGAWEEGVTRLDSETGKVEGFTLALGPKGLAALFCLARQQADRVPMVRAWWRGWSAPLSLAKPVGETLSQPVFSLCPGGSLALWRLGEGAASLLLFSQRHGAAPARP